LRVIFPYKCLIVNKKTWFDTLKVLNVSPRLCDAWIQARHTQRVPPSGDKNEIVVAWPQRGEQAQEGL
jgi:hypothetical protein